MYNMILGMVMVTMIVKRTVVTESSPYIGHEIRQGKDDDENEENDDD
jgi:hypothetical protein